MFLWRVLVGDLEDGAKYQSKGRLRNILPTGIALEGVPLVGMAFAGVTCAGVAFAGVTVVGSTPVGMG